MNLIHPFYSLPLSRISAVHAIQGALQPVSVPPASAHLPTLNTVAVTYIPEPGAPLACTWEHSNPSISRWPPPPENCTWPQWPKGKPEVSSFFNPNQIPEHNLPGCGITRTVGGMATHWTCACPRPHPEEYKNSPIKKELPDLLGRAETLLNVMTDQFDNSIRHKLVKSILEKHPNFKGRVRNLPLGVQRNEENENLVTWTGTNTVLGKWASPEYCCTNPKCKCEECLFSLHPEHKVVRLNREKDGEGRLGAIDSVHVHNLRTGERLAVRASIFIIACGAICTPQILWNSGFGDRGGGSPNPELRALGRYLNEQSLSFCQIVLKRECVRVLAQPTPLSDDQGQHPLAPFEWSKKELEVIQEKCKAHQDKFRNDPLPIPFNDPEPQMMVTARSMMLDMCDAAHALGAFLPGSYPQLMTPGLALHITGTTRIGKNASDSVANEFSQVHGHPNLYVGGNSVIPDSTACNPTLASVVYAIHSASDIVRTLRELSNR